MDARPSLMRLAIAGAVIAVASILLATSASGHYQLWTVWQKTISPVYMRARLSLNDYDSSHWSGSASSASFVASTGSPRSIESIYARGRGQWRCDFSTYTRWDVARWEYNSSLAAAGGSGTFSRNCAFSSIISSEGWYKFRNTSIPLYPYINEDAHAWKCEVEYLQGIC